MSNTIYFQYVSKYECWYYNIINKAQSQFRSKNGEVYYESHHIIPKSLGGIDSEENLVLLTGREHFICHWLLYKFSEGVAKHKMAYAWFMMCNTENDKQNRYIPPSRIYEAARTAKTSTPVSDVTRKRQSESQMGKTIPKIIREKISQTLQGRTKSEKHRENLSKSLKGKKKSQEHLSKISKSRTGGSKWTDDQKAKSEDSKTICRKGQSKFFGVVHNTLGSL